MTADIVVRMRVKPRREEDLIDKNKQSDVEAAKELTRIALDKTGGRDYCLVGESDGMDPIAAARPLMISTLDSFRDTLEQLGDGMGVTDGVSGEVVLES